jgi:transcriptional regulator with XRE-family HTH domain
MERAITNRVKELRAARGWTQEQKARLGARSRVDFRLWFDSTAPRQ